MKYMYSFLVLLFSCFLDSVFAGYTTYSSNAGYTQPHGQYVPYYHANLDYQYKRNIVDDGDVRRNVHRRIVSTDLSHNASSYVINAHKVTINNNYYNSYPHFTLGFSDISHNIPAASDCQTAVHLPHHGTYYRDLGLRIPESLSSVKKYRIQWSDGGRSQRYMPGNDVDMSRFSHSRGQQRMWAYFDSHTYQVTTCSSRQASVYNQNNHYYTSFSRLISVPTSRRWNTLNVEKYRSPTKQTVRTWRVDKYVSP